MVDSEGNGVIHSHKDHFSNKFALSHYMDVVKAVRAKVFISRGNYVISINGVDNGVGFIICCQNFGQGFSGLLERHDIDIGLSSAYHLHDFE
jgi:hypothetical protein